MRGGEKENRGVLLLDGRDRVRLLANIGVRTFPANQACSHLSPRKSTVEPKVAFPTLAGLPGPAPTSSSSGYSNPGLWGSLCTSSPLSAVGGRLWLPRLQGAFSCRFPPHTRPGGLPQYRPPGHRRSPRPQPARAAQASGLSREWGFGSPPNTHPPPLLQCPPGDPLSASASCPGGLGRQRGSGGARTHAGSPEPGVGRREPSPEPRGLLLQKGEENGEELGGRLSGKEGS